jgi:hypothetical protein
MEFTNTPEVESIGSAAGELGASRIEFPVRVAGN